MALGKESLVFHDDLTVSDRLVLESLARDCENYHQHHDDGRQAKEESRKEDGRVDSLEPEILSTDDAPLSPEDEATAAALKGLNSPLSSKFIPTVFVSVDLPDLKVNSFVRKHVLEPYVRWARSVVRVETDVVMITHLLLYFTTSIPSAVYLFYDFHWWHGLAHFVMQMYYVGTYTLMMHQHIHMRGILAKKYWLFDLTFPFLTDPLMGHTWNSYYYHHVKHHHVEGNGPDDLSSTIRYQRDSAWSFLCYVGRFYFFIWLDLPSYFLRKRKTTLALKAFGSETAYYLTMYLLATRVNFHATLFALIMPLALLRIGLMIGNWGQHAFVDEVDPTSDFRSSITLIDVASNRYCFNDGYHTSHHLNPLRHWRQHPQSFLQQKHQYASEHALVFHDIDFLMITLKLLQKDYAYLARCLVPMGEQIGMSMEQRAAMLQSKTRAFSDQEVQRLFSAKQNPSVGVDGKKAL